jgi:DNA adenine methylase
LRYPGGKARLSPFFAQVIRGQTKKPEIYAEPFAGGAGAALHLLADGLVNQIFINDLNPGIAAFWRSVFYETDHLTEMIANTSVTMDNWWTCREVYLSPRGRDDLELGFATFFLNRVNRSGILGARPIGGLEQLGNWKMDARFNRNDLISRIQRLGRMRTQVVVEELEAIDFLDSLSSIQDRLFLYLDPPYVGQGRELYLDSLTMQDHGRLASALSNLGSVHWVLTYDAKDIVIDQLYPQSRCLEFDISHTAQAQHIGSEYMIFSDTLVINEINVLPASRAAWLRI